MVLKVNFLPIYPKRHFFLNSTSTYINMERSQSFPLFQMVKKPLATVTGRGVAVKNGPSGPKGDHGPLLAVITLIIYLDDWLIKASLSAWRRKRGENGRARLRLWLKKYTCAARGLLFNSSSMEENRRPERDSLKKSIRRRPYRMHCAERARAKKPRNWTEVMTAHLLSPISSLTSTSKSSNKIFCRFKPSYFTKISDSNLQAKRLWICITNCSHHPSFVKWYVTKLEIVYHFFVNRHESKTLYTDDRVSQNSTNSDI